MQQTKKYKAASIVNTVNKGSSARGVGTVAGFTWFLQISFFLLALVLTTNLSLADPLKLVTGSGYPPFTGRDLPNGGMATEIVQRVFAEMGYEVTVDFKPWKRGYNDTKKKKYLGTFPYGKNAKRQQDFYYSQPLYNFAQYFFAKSEAPIKFTKDEDLQGLKVCLPIGYNPQRLQEMVDKGIVTLVRPADMEACFVMLERGRADLVRVDQYVGWSVIEKLFNTKQGFRVLDKPVRENIEHLIIAKDHADGTQLIEQFDKTLESLKAEGVIEEIIQRHIK